MSEVQVTLPPVLAEYLKQAAKVQGTGFTGTVRSIRSSHIASGKATPTPSGSSKRYTLRFPIDMAQWCARQGGKAADVVKAVLWLSYLSTLTSEEHDSISVSSLLAMVGLRLLPGEETERETMQ